LWPLCLFSPWLAADVLPSDRLAGQSSQQVVAENITVSLLSEQAVVVPGRTVSLALRLQHAEGWHSHWKNSAGSELATTVQWQLPAGFRGGELEWPLPEALSIRGETHLIYRGDTWLLLPLSLPASIFSKHSPESLGGKLNLSVDMAWSLWEERSAHRAGGEHCRSDRARLQIELPIQSRAAAPSASADAMVSEQWAASFSVARKKIPPLIYSRSSHYRADQEALHLYLADDALQAMPHISALWLGEAQRVDSSQPLTQKQVVGGRLFSLKLSQPLLQTPLFLSVLLVSDVVGDKAGDDGVAADVAEIFLPYIAEASVTANGAERKAAPVVEVVTADGASLLSILLLSLFGGLILNAMPCVFPVLSLKVVGLIESGRQSPAARRQQGIAYAVGVISSFLLIAGLLILLRSLGQQVGWGFQLQSPLFVAGLIYLFFILALSLSGWLEIGSSLPGVVSRFLPRGDDRSHWRQAFSTGVLATIGATPCTAPFMATAMSFALSQSLAIALSVFAVMGLGLALPFVLIAFVPLLANALPQPGAWMLRVKQWLALPLYLTVLWLLWVLSRQLGALAVIAALLGLLFIALWLGLARRWQRRQESMRLRRVSRGCAALALALLFVVAAVERPISPLNVPPSSDLSLPYSTARLQSARAGGAAVFVNMTADWCITCQVNERVALSSDAVRDAFYERGIVYLKGDWTHRDARVSDYLSQFNRDGVPLYVYYPPRGEPIVLPQILTPAIVLEAIGE